MVTGVVASIDLDLQPKSQIQILKPPPHPSLQVPGHAGNPVSMKFNLNYLINFQTFRSRLHLEQQRLRVGCELLREHHRTGHL